MIILSQNSIYSVLFLVLLLTGTFFLLFVPASNHSLLKFIALNVSCLSYVISLFLWVFFNKSIGSFQFVSQILWILFLNLNFTLGIDGISLFFIILTTLLIFVCLVRAKARSIESTKSQVTLKQLSRTYSSVLSI